MSQWYCTRPLCCGFALTVFERVGNHRLVWRWDTVTRHCDANVTISDVTVGTALCSDDTPQTLCAVFTVTVYTLPVNRCRSRQYTQLSTAMIHRKYWPCNRSTPESATQRYTYDTTNRVSELCTARQFVPRQRTHQPNQTNDRIVIQSRSLTHVTAVTVHGILWLHLMFHSVVWLNFRWMRWLLETQIMLQNKRQYNVVFLMYFLKTKWAYND